MPAASPHATPAAPERGYARLLTATGVALLVVVLADVLLARVAAPKVLIEVDDAVTAYRHADPTVLVLGSSHARSFTEFDRLAHQQTDGRTRILSVPLEYGKFSGYDWVLEHRLRPLIEELDAQGQLRRPSLRDLVLIGEWWDATTPDEGRPAVNLPARAWRFQDFADDAWRNGFTARNQNYLQQRWRMLFRHSSLVQDHGHGRILSGLKALVRPPDPAVEQARFAAALAEWRAWLERSHDKFNDPVEWAAVERIFQYARGRGLRVTMLLYPRMPSSISPTARDGTFRLFAERMSEVCQRHGVRMIDWSWSSPLGDHHFAADIDHVTPEGSRVLAEWGLAGDMAFLTRAAIEAAPISGSR
jgi:hypothetical protein